MTAGYAKSDKGAMPSMREEKVESRIGTKKERAMGEEECGLLTVCSIPSLARAPLGAPNVELDSVAVRGRE